MSEIDDIIAHKDAFIYYLIYEYTISIVLSCACFALILYYFTIYLFGNNNSVDPFSLLWLCFTIICRAVDVFIKGLIIYQLRRIINENSELVLRFRRLLYLSRSFIFFYNSQLSKALLYANIIYFVAILKVSLFGNISQNSIDIVIPLLLSAYFVRILMTLLSYNLYFMVYCRIIRPGDKNSNYDDCLCPNQINSIPTISINEENKEKYMIDNTSMPIICCICIMNLAIGDEIKVLPCNSIHSFHKSCIDKWFKHSKFCPTCRDNIKTKITSNIDWLYNCKSKLNGN